MTESEPKTTDVQSRGARSGTPPPTKRKGDQGSASSSSKQSGKSEKDNGKEQEKEFGGPVGAAFIMVTSHALLFFMAASIYGTDVNLYMPSTNSVAFFALYHGSQFLFARFMPGVLVHGPSGLDYLCNAYSTLYATLGCAIVLHLCGLFDLTSIVVDFPSYLTTGIIWADIFAVVIHLVYAKGSQVLSVYDFFIGVVIHPRIGEVIDIKMVAETRVSWTLLFLITLGSWVQSYRQLGSWLNPACFMVLAHGLYANACAKGEHFIPYTWDITTEKFGWMLCWWNLAGVPLLYCYQSLFLAQCSWASLILPPVPAWLYYAFISVSVVCAYWIWDESNYHKCYFKAQMRGDDLLTRNLFPTFRHVENPKYIKCEAGVLLTDGWYKYARKIPYTADAAMALLWGLSCGFSSLLPYVYFGFFAAMITHRAARDEARCREKYGATWDKYLKEVPYRFVPFVY